MQTVRDDMNLALSAQQAHLLRLKAQRLLPSSSRLAASPAQVIKAVIGVQAQELPAALLSVRARSAGLTAAQVEQARQEQRSIAWTWCMRGTLHLITSEDAAWLVPFLGPGFIEADRRRLRQLGWDEQLARRGIQLVQAALVEQKELTSSEIARLLEANGLPFEGQAPFHLLYRAALEGRLCRGPARANKPTYVLFETWLGETRPLAYETALAQIARRYLEAYGPAGPQDMASWSGLKLGAARQAWQLIADQVVQVKVDGSPSWLLRRHLPRLDETFEAEPVVRLLPRFDTYLLGYADREMVVDPPYARYVHPGGGLIYPVLLVDGRAQGIWKTRRRKTHLEIELTPFESLPEARLPGIEAEAADIARFLDAEAELIIEEPFQG